MPIGNFQCDGLLLYRCTFAVMYFDSTIGSCLVTGMRPGCPDTRKQYGWHPVVAKFYLVRNCLQGNHYYTKDIQDETEGLGNHMSARFAGASADKFLHQQMIEPLLGKSESLPSSGLTWPRRSRPTECGLCGQPVANPQVLAQGRPILPSNHTIKQRINPPCARKMAGISLDSNAGNIRVHIFTEHSTVALDL